METYIRMKDLGASEPQILKAMSDDGISTIDAIKIYRVVFATSLQDAKARISQSEFWNAQHRKSQTLHEVATEMLKKAQS